MEETALDTKHDREAYKETDKQCPSCVVRIVIFLLFIIGIRYKLWTKRITETTIWSRQSDKP